MLKTPRRRYKDTKNNYQHSEVLHLLSHEEVPERPKQNAKVYNKGDDRRHTKEHPNEKIWEDKFHRGKEVISTWLALQPNKEDIRNARYVKANFGSVIGIKY